jgi:hypothetical protein
MAMKGKRIGTTFWWENRPIFKSEKRIGEPATVFFLVKIYLQYVNTHTSVPGSTKIVPGQPISCRTLAVRGGHGDSVLNRMNIDSCKGRCTRDPIYTK